MEYTPEGDFKKKWKDSSVPKQDFRLGVEIQQAQPFTAIIEEDIEESILKRQIGD